MESIRQAGMTICGIGMLGTIVGFLLPKTSVSKMVKAAAGVFFTAAVLLSLTKINWENTLDFSKAREYREKRMLTVRNERIGALTENAVSDAIFGALIKEGFHPEKVEVSLHMNQTNSIEFDRITVTVPKKEADAVKLAVEAAYGVTPVIKGKNDD